MQLFKNPTKAFIPYIYYLELKLLPSSSNKKCSAKRGSLNEINIALNYQKSCWKVKIERLNFKDNTEKLPLDITESAYEGLILNEAAKLLKLIERVGKSQLKSMRTFFLINNVECTFG